jgi:hypothetical protein|tara:strand:+ start:41 stop:502 length:462 start_codon:yes stop_codon:yes gene_type:complete
MARLTVNEAGTSGYTHVISLSFDDLAKIKLGTDPFNGETLGTAGQLPIATIPAGGAVELAGVFESTALAGASDITLDVGTTGGDPDEFIDNLDVDGMSAPVFNSGESFTGNQSQAVPFQAETSVLAEVNGTTASLTAGNIVIGLRIIDLGSFA